MLATLLRASLVVVALAIVPQRTSAAGETASNEDEARAERWEKKSEAVKPERKTGDDSGDAASERSQKKSKASGKRADE